MVTQNPLWAVCVLTCTRMPTMPPPPKRLCKFLSHEVTESALQDVSSPQATRYRALTLQGQSLDPLPTTTHVAWESLQRSWWGQGQGQGRWHQAPGMLL